MTISLKLFNFIKNNKYLIILILILFAMVIIKFDNILIQWKGNDFSFELDKNGFIEKETYDITQVVGINSLVEGDTGKYYSINLYELERKDTFKFKEGKFKINPLIEKKFSKSINQFIESFYSLENVKNAKLYIIGQADIKGDKQDCIDSIRNNDLSKFRVFKIHRKRPYTENSFLKEYSDAYIPECYQNKHLPLLMARFIQQTLTNEGYKEITTPDILEGSVQQELGDEYRNASIFMFVGKKKNFKEIIKNLGSDENCEDLLLTILLLLFVIVIIIWILDKKRKSRKF